MQDRDKIACAEDGEGYEAFVCKHLFENPAQQWYSREPSSENPWPDAWCGACDKVFMRDGEWTDENSACIEIKLICHHCYERRRALEVSDIGEGL